MLNRYSIGSGNAINFFGTNLIGTHTDSHSVSAGYSAEYRADIDGLRALAVLVVVAYHADLSVFTSGFLGVDIFFVISGFLISGIIIDEHHGAGFSYLDFYIRRARRLLPALFIVLLATFFAGWFILLPEDLNEYANSVIWALLFGSNFFFVDNVHYFSQAAEFMPALHTWSLAVEEQFYLMWPLVLGIYIWVSNKLSWKTALLVLAIPVGLSLIGYLMMADDSPDQVFFMTWFRLWELGIGALVAVLVRHWQPLTSIKASLLYAIGIAFVVYGLFSPDSDHVGYVMDIAFVCVGTALMLLFGNVSGNPLAGLFSARLPVAIGKISYGLYLWHWPVFALFRVYQNDVHIQPLDAAWLTGLSVALATASYVTVEKPLRRTVSLKVSVLAIVMLGLCTGMFALASVQTSGFKARIASGADYVASREIMLHWPCDEENIAGLGTYCVFGASRDTADATIMLWGDSHSRHFAPLVEKVAVEQKIRVILYFTCAPFIDHVDVEYMRAQESYSRKCGELRRTGIDWLKQTDEKIDAIIFAARWSDFDNKIRTPGDRKRTPNAARLIKKSLSSLVSEIDESIQILFLSDVPSPTQNLVHCAYEALPGIWRKELMAFCQPMPVDKVKRNQDWTTKVLKKVAKKSDRAQAIDVVDRMCDEKSCPLFLEGRLLYRDDNHIRSNLTDTEIETLVALLDLRQVLSKLIQAAKQPKP